MNVLSRSRPVALVALVALLGNALVDASAAELTVKVIGIASPTGQIGCALFKGPDGFPMDNSAARQLWLPADPKGVVCRFGDVMDGSYAVSVAYDLNGNRKVDTNFLGIPTEPWGVSNNVRPALRAPRFEEAAIRVAGGKDLGIEIEVAK